MLYTYKTDIDGGHHLKFIQMTFEADSEEKAWKKANAAMLKLGVAPINRVNAWVRKE